MWQIKVFECDKIQDLESMVNKWLADNPGIEISQIAQSESGGADCEWTISFSVLF